MDFTGSISLGAVTLAGVRGAMNGVWGIQGGYYGDFVSDRGQLPEFDPGMRYRLAVDGGPTMNVHVMATAGPGRGAAEAVFRTRGGSPSGVAARAARAARARTTGRDSPDSGGGAMHFTRVGRYTINWDQVTYIEEDDDHEAGSADGEALTVCLSDGRICRFDGPEAEAIRTILDGLPGMTGPGAGAEIR